MLRQISPRPVRLFSTFGPAANEDAGKYRFGAHPETRLVFALPAGRHILRTTFFFPVETNRKDLAEGEVTDGVEVRFELPAPGGVRRTQFTRLLDPSQNMSDRGERPLVIEFDLTEPGEVELSFSSGPLGRDTRDWISIGPLTISRR